MRLRTKLFAGIFALWLGLGSNHAAEFNRDQILETWGWILARDHDVARIEINDTELAVFLKGFNSGITRQPLTYDVKIFPDVERLAKARRVKLVQAIEQKNEAAARSFFAGLKTNATTMELAGGVRCEILKPGSGAAPKPGQTVNVHYLARLLDGTEFGQMGPIDMVLVTNRSVCRGWIEALQKMKPGGVLKLYVPPPRSAEEATHWGIEPGSAMIFEIELMDVKDTSPEDLANSTLPPPPEPEAPPPSGYTESQIMETWGWSIARQTRADKFEWTEAELSRLTKGLAAGIQGKPAPFDLSQIYPQVQQFIQDRREQARLKVKQQRRAEMETLFAGLKKNPNVVELPDGLRYEITRAGHGSHPKPGQIVLVDYTARLVDGTIFDKTYNEPLHVEVGSVIAGWNEGIQKINPGGRIKLYIPPSLGYGDEDMSGVVSAIPADSTLIYEIELLEIQDPVKEDAATVPEKK